MSKATGTTVLLAGLGALGVWTYADHASDMEETVTSGARAVTQQATHDVTATVSGRDIVLSGLVDSAAEEEALLASANGVEGRRVVRSDLRILPSVSPYITEAVKSPNGGYSATGTVPSNAVASALVTASSISAVGDLPLGAGAPAGYDMAATTGLTALAQLQEGTFSITDADVVLTGISPDAATLSAVQNAMSGLSPDFNVTETVTFIPTASPYVMTVDKDAADTYTAVGFVPDDAVTQTLSDQAQSDAFAQLAIANGAPDGWAASAAQSVDALGQLSTGRLEMEDNTIILTGTAPSAEAEAAIASQLAAIEGFDVINRVTFTPEEVPSDMTVRYDRVRGLFVSGLAPQGLTGANVASRLGAPAVVGSFDAVGTDDTAPVTNSVDVITPLLPEFEMMELTVRGDETILEGDLLAESDLARVTALAEESGAFTLISLANSDARYRNGETRPNPLSGVTEVYQNGFWLPEVSEEDLTVANCDNSTRDILAEQAVNFITASADLDVTSRATLSAVTALALACFEENPNLTLVIEGHTDNVGNDSDNQSLSEARAATVRDAMIERGVARSRISAEGFGESQPIADNDTDEGRSQNRRTVLVWVDG